MKDNKYFKDEKNISVKVEGSFEVHRNKAGKIIREIKLADFEEI